MYVARCDFDGPTLPTMPQVSKRGLLMFLSQRRLWQAHPIASRQQPPACP